MDQNPYRTLGVSPGATLREIRRAYRRAVLRCHPDSCPDDPAQAVQRFYEVTRAYRTVLRTFQPAMSPSEYARLDSTWLAAPRWMQAGAAGRPDHAGAIRVTRPTRNENVVFVGVWLVACATAGGAGVLWMKLHMARKFAEDLVASDFLVLWALPTGICLVVMAATVGLLVLSREVVWLMYRLGLAARRLLPVLTDRRQLP